MYCSKCTYNLGTFAVMSLMVGQVVASHPLMIELKSAQMYSNETALHQAEIDAMAVGISQTLTLLVGVILVGGAINGQFQTVL